MRTIGEGKDFSNRSTKKEQDIMAGIEKEVKNAVKNKAGGKGGGKKKGGGSGAEKAKSAAKKFLK